MSTVDKIKAALATTRERQKVYGESGKNFRQHGEIMKAIFPDGITLTTIEDFARFTLFDLVVVKLGRYANNWTKGGHQDSIHDMGVYSFIIEDFDEKCLMEKTNENVQGRRANDNDRRNGKGSRRPRRRAHRQPTPRPSGGNNNPKKGS